VFDQQDGLIVSRRMGCHRRKAVVESPASRFTPAALRCDRRAPVVKRYNLAVRPSTRAIKGITGLDEGHGPTHEDEEVKHEDNSGDDDVQLATWEQQVGGHHI
jgi:hypothetical protein